MPWRLGRCQVSLRAAGHAPAGHRHHSSTGAHRERPGEALPVCWSQSRRWRYCRPLWRPRHSASAHNQVMPTGRHRSWGPLGTRRRPCSDQVRRRHLILILIRALIRSRTRYWARTTTYRNTKTVRTPADRAESDSGAESDSETHIQTRAIRSHRRRRRRIGRAATQSLIQVTRSVSIYSHGGNSQQILHRTVHRLALVHRRRAKIDRAMRVCSLDTSVSAGASMLNAIHTTGSRIVAAAAAVQRRPTSAGVSSSGGARPSANCDRPRP